MSLVGRELSCCRCVLAGWAQSQQHRNTTEWAAGTNWLKVSYCPVVASKNEEHTAKETIKLHKNLLLTPSIDGAVSNGGCQFSQFSDMMESKAHY